MRAPVKKFVPSLKTVGLVLGPTLFLGLLLMPTPDGFLVMAEAKAAAMAVDAATLAAGAQVTLALMALMVVWWVTEAIPIPVTALLPAVILPLGHVAGLSDDGKTLVAFDAKRSLAGYASPVIYLFLGGFLLAGAMQKSGLDRRMTLWILTRGRLAERSSGVLLGLMASTACLSMWISNTAAAAIMLPLAIGILRRAGCEPGRSNFGMALMLGVAWSASIGGVGTLIGSPPNGIGVALLAGAGLPRPNFLQWMSFGVPYVALFVPVAWGLLCRMFPFEVQTLAGGKEAMMAERAALGPWRKIEKTTTGIFGVAVCLWVTTPFLQHLLPADIAARLAWVDEYVIGVLAGVLLFVVPVGLRQGESVLTWKEGAAAVEWGTLLLFGGGIALSDAVFRTGLAEWMAMSFVSTLGNPPPWVLIGGVVLLMNFLTEVTSNTAVTSMMVPVLIAMAQGVGADPTTLAVAASVAASMAFMLPVATPPNALVFGTGYVPMRTMVKAGFVLDLVGWLLTVGVLYVFGDLLLGILSF